jgi:hypothetical protein
MRKPIKILPLLFLTILGLCIQTSCARVTLPATLEASKTPGLPSLTTSVTPSSTPTATATLTQTATLTPTLTSSPTSTPTTLPTKRYKPLPTVVPPLDDQQRAAYLQNLLTTNGGCKLPCLLGVIPGQSSWEDVKSLFTAVGKNRPLAFTFSKYGLVDYHYSFTPDQENQKSIFWNTSFYVSKNDVNIIHFEVQSNTSSPAFTTSYSLKPILEALGIPARIGLQIIVIPDAPKNSFYVLDLNYLLKDVSVLVVSHAEMDG